MNEKTQEPVFNRRLDKKERRMQDRRQNDDLNYDGEERRTAERRMGEERRFVQLSDYSYDVEQEM